MISYGKVLVVIGYFVDHGQLAIDDEKIEGQSLWSMVYCLSSDARCPLVPVSDLLISMTDLE